MKYPLPLLLSLLFLTFLPACEMIEKATPGPRAGRAEATGFPITVSPVMRGTVASETIILGYQPVIARGYGLVVGLRGTGSRDIPPMLRAHMLEEAARKGVGSRRNQWNDLTPERLLDSPDTAVVIVEAVIPPGSVGRQTISSGARRAQMPGTRFDIRVKADPRTGTSSLEGGVLWTTELRPGPLQAGGRQAFAIAEAHGPIFVNPYAEPNAEGLDSVNRLSGKILNGGEVVKDLPLKLRLGRPSHQRAAMIQNAINRTFPQEPGQHDLTARGESDESIEITVPPSWRDRTMEFVELMRHTSLWMAGAETVAMSVRRAVVKTPEIADDASWRWQALGARALPIIAELYDHPDVLPRMAALRTGAKLNDPRAARPLIEMTTHESAQHRKEAVRLIGDLVGNPGVTLALRKCLNDEDIDVRLAAYEVMVKRGDPAISRWIVDDKFVLDVVNSDKPMIYVTQLGMPRIAIFGRNLAIERPVFIRMWSNRLMIKETDDDRIEIYYRAPEMSRGTTDIVSPALADLIVFLGHASDIDHPAPGLGLGYGKTVGAIYQIWRQNGLPGTDFKTEQDRILAQIMEQRTRLAVPERPEFSDPDFDFLNPPPEGGALEEGAGGTGEDGYISIPGAGSDGVEE